MKAKHIAIAFFLFFSACKAKDENTHMATTTQTETTQTTEVAKPAATTPNTNAGNRYNIKSAKVAYDINMASTKGTQTLLFDNFGNVELRTSEIMGVKNYTLLKDGFVYSWSNGANNGMKMAMRPEQNMNYENLPDSIKKTLKLSESGTTTLAGKKAKLMSLEISGIKTFLTIWNGVPLKTDVSSANMPMSQIATSVDENPTIAPGTFDLPKNVNFQMMDGKMPGF